MSIETMKMNGLDDAQSTPKAKNKQVAGVSLLDLSPDHIGTLIEALQAHRENSAQAAHDASGSNDEGAGGDEDYHNREVDNATELLKRLGAE